MKKKTTQTLKKRNIEFLRYRGKEGRICIVILIFDWENTFKNNIWLIETFDSKFFILQVQMRNYYFEVHAWVPILYMILNCCELLWAHFFCLELIQLISSFIIIPVYDFFLYFNFWFILFIQYLFMLMNLNLWKNDNLGITDIENPKILYIE